MLRSQGLDAGRAHCYSVITASADRARCVCVFIYMHEIQPVHPEGDQPWDFFGGNDAEAETPVLWPPHVKS